MITKQKPFHNSVDIAVDSNLLGEDSWVVVKKQKVAILIPRLPSSDQCGLPDLDLSQPQLSPQNPHGVCLVERDDDVIPLSPESDSQPGLKHHDSPDTAVPNPRSENMDSRMHNIEEDGLIRPFCRKKRSHPKLHETIHKLSRSFKEQDQLRVTLLRCTTILQKTMRASNLDIKIARAGGLRKWLSSLGLEQFERVFRGKSVHNFHVASLSMSKLKDMGYHAVGPRRKLIHAIECPY